MNFENANERLANTFIKWTCAFSLVCVLLSASFARAIDTVNSATSAGTTISNRADASYEDEAGAQFSTVSQTVHIVVAAVPAIAVTPDETAPSAIVAPNETFTRLFRICNTGNVEDAFLPTRAFVSAPAQIKNIYFDTDDSGTITGNDERIQIGLNSTPRLAPGACLGVLFDVDANSVAVNSQLVFNLSARSTATLPNGETAADDGAIINSVGDGARFTSPGNTSLPPSKLVENSARAATTAGQILNYSISFRNAGAVAANQVRVLDNLPAELEYVPNTLRLNSRSLTDAADADEGTATMRRVELSIAQIAPEAVTQIQFQARLTGANLNGVGVMNSAQISAANVSAINTAEAVAVVNPLGTVYAGNSGGAVRVSGAEVKIATDNAGTPLDLPARAGFAPNPENANAFLTDANGNFSFALAANQLGTTGNAAHYYVLISAPNYRSRVIEVSIQPRGASGFFTANVRALDDQAVAVANGFALTSEMVELSNLGALVFNIPLFENSTLEISKSADKQTAEIGDIVSYRIQVKNATASIVSNAVVRDRLPESFVYAEGTAEIQTGASAQKIEPEISGGELIFRLGDLAAGASATISYRTRVGASATEGDHYNSAFVTGTQGGGNSIATQPARALVRVRGGAFSMRQVIVGRVFEDRNGNGNFDAGERAVSGARVYMNNGQSVVTDSAGQYNLPAVSAGSIVLSLDPTSVPAGYHLQNEDGRRETKSWTRLLRTPLGGGALLRQNFAIAPDSERTAIAGDAKTITASGNSMNAPAPTGTIRSNTQDAKVETEDKRPLEIASLENKIPLGSPVSSAKNSSETFTVEATENVEAVAPGGIKILTPKMRQVIMSPALSVTARVAENWTIEAEINGAKVDAGNIGETRIDHRNQVATFSFVGINLKPGVNSVKLTAVGANGERGTTEELKVFGRGAVAKLEILQGKSQAGDNAIPVEIRAYDEAGNPAADGQIAVEASSGRFAAGSNSTEDQSAESARQQIVSLVDGRAVVRLVGEGSASDTARVKAIAGRREASADIRFTQEIRPTLLVGLADFTIGKNAPEIASTGDESTGSRLAFYFRGRLFGTRNLLTLAYDSQQALNRVAGRDRFGDFDPTERAYPIFGDSSQRFEDAQSNSKIYARLDRGRSYAMFGDMQADLDNLSLSGYGRKLTGAKIHLENERGDFVSLTGARPDTAFARDVIPGGGLSVTRLSHADILTGSELVFLEVRDRRNPEIILKREQFIRSVDYNLDARTGEIFFLRPISTFDYQLNLIQIVATYEYRGGGASNYVYTGRAVKNFKQFGLRVGASYVNQQQQEIGAFHLGGLDLEKSLPMGGKFTFESAMSRGRFASGVNVFDFYNPENSNLQNADASRERNGFAFHATLDQPLAFFHSRLRADFQRAAGNFYNPFGGSVVAGTQRAQIALEIAPSANRNISLGFTDERNRTENVSNSRQTVSLLWAEQWLDNLRTSIGFDHRNLSDNLTGKTVASNLFTAGVEYRPIEKLELSVKREQNLGDADPTYPDQTTLAANYQVSKFAKLFFTQRLASAPVTPIGDYSGGGFTSVGSRRETAFGIETKIEHLGAFNGRYQLENGANGTDSFAVFGLQNRWALSKNIALETGFERGFLLKGDGKSFNSATFGATWSPVEGFRTSARYELRDRNGLGQLFALGAAGKIGDNWTTAARASFATSSYSGRGGSASNITTAAAYRPLDSDKYALLFSYNNRTTMQKGSIVNGIAQAATRERADTLSTDGIYQLSKSTEIYGRFALRFNGNGNSSTAYASALTYLAQIRAQQRLNDFLDFAAEFKTLNQSSSNTFRRSAGAELGFWAMPDLRLGLGYNFTRASRFEFSSFDRNRQSGGGFYFTITSKLSNLFDLFGTSSKGLAAQQENDEK